MWGKLDWPNLIAGPFLALLIAFVTKKAYPVWSVSRESTKIVLRKLNKASIERDLEKILNFKNDSNTMTIWFARKLVSLLMASVLLILAAIGFAVTMTSPFVYETFDAKLPWGMTSVNLWFSLWFGTLAGIIMGEITEFPRVAKYYDNFEEFTKQAQAMLSEEEIKSIEKAVKAKALRK